MALRVIQWSTGNVGRFCLRAILGHPGLELDTQDRYLLTWLTHTRQRGPVDLDRVRGDPVKLEKAQERPFEGNGEPSNVALQFVDACQAMQVAEARPHVGQAAPLGDLVRQPTTIVVQFH